MCAPAIPELKAESEGLFPGCTGSIGPGGLSSVKLSHKGKGGELEKGRNHFNILGMLSY